MTGQDDITRTAEQLRAALGTAASLMAVRDAPPLRQEQPIRRTRGWLLPLTAAASVVVIALGVVLAVHLARPAATAGGTQNAAQAPRPGFYMTETYASAKSNDLLFQVRRTAGGAVTGSMTFPAAHQGWVGDLTAAANDRAFYFAYYSSCTKAATATTFARITITGTGRISGVTAVARAVPGVVTDFAVSPDGSRMAYNAVAAGCPSLPGRLPVMTGDVQIMDLSTGAVRTWRDTADAPAHGLDVGLSWAPDGRTLVVGDYVLATRKPQVTAYRLDTASGGGSLQAHSTTVLRQTGQQQGGLCSGCVRAVLAGPDGSLTVLKTEATRQAAHLLVVRIPAAGGPQTVLYSELSDAARPLPINATGLIADPSGQWLLLWPTGVGTAENGQLVEAATGWISGGRLRPLPSAATHFPQGIAW